MPTDTKPQLYRIEPAPDAVYIQRDNDGWEYVAEVRHSLKESKRAAFEDLITAAHIASCLAGTDARTRALVEALEFCAQFDGDPTSASLDLCGKHARAALALAKGTP